jgi:acyl dehydratase
MSQLPANILRFEDIEIGRKEILTRTITEIDVGVFEALSGDNNPLHMNDEFGAHTPFGRRVVHGLFTGALISTTHTRLTGPGFVYVGQELRFLGPVFIDDTLTIEVTVAEKKPAKRILVMQTVVQKHTGERVLEGRSALKELELI